MALSISGYTDPGVIVGEVITPAGISIATVPDILGIVANQIVDYSWRNT